MVSLQAEVHAGPFAGKLTGPLIRAGRALARISAAELAAEAGLSIVTVKRAEASDGVGSLRQATAEAIIAALGRRGVVLFDANDLGGAGVRYRSAAASPGGEGPSD